MSVILLYSFVKKHLIPNQAKLIPPNESMITLPNYIFTEIIYTGTKSRVYRGYRQSDKTPVVVKILNTEYPPFKELVLFRNQYTLAKNLEIKGIITPYSLENYRNGYALVMEDFGGMSLDQYTEGKPLPLDKFFPLAIALVQILEDLSKQRVIHKDIKPQNILINPKTKEVKLIDFSIASLLSRETQTIINPNVLEGTISYISPEQTGRMNRGIDYRTDFYSLGVTFFELLTGELPFSAKDPMELVHCHLAKNPPKVHSLNPNIPPILSEIISLLMEKTPEARYQSALGLKHDLETCQQEWEKTGRIPDAIASFALKSLDLCDRFIIPEKIYGRQREIDILLTAFERVATPPINNEKPRIEMMLVAGFSGIGKTAIVNEVNKPIVRRRGYFIKGKFDQFNRNIPLSSFVQAFRDLMEQISSENPTKLAQWQAKIISELGENAQVIIEVIPELERIIGQQPPVVELSGSAAQNRFNLLFQKFLQIFTTKEHPLVIFIDDLQWADTASLKLIKLLMTEGEKGYLLLIGAYRDNEVSPTHALTLTLDEIEKSGATIDTITLEPLGESDLNHLVADTLNCVPEFAFNLTNLVHQKTQGNPFFATQFIKFLYESRLIQFNRDLGYWQCDIAKVRVLSVTDDVVEFMSLQLQKLPNSTQEVLKLAACIGNQFDLETLAIISEKYLSETATDLWKSLQENLVIPTSDIYKFYHEKEEEDEKVDSENINNLRMVYKFLHDRVQQAAYSLIPDAEKKATHLKIGQLLLKNTPTEKREEEIFEIVNQLNIGADLITSQSEKNELAKLNFLAGKKAKAAIAYGGAVEYLTLGLALLPEDKWTSHYDLTLSLSVEAVESEYLNTNFEGANLLAETVLSNTENILDQVKIYELKIAIYMAQLQAQLAIDTGLSILEKLGITLEPEPPETANIEQLINLPEMTDPYKMGAMRILIALFPACFSANPHLFRLQVFKMVNLCIQYGNSPLAAFAYVLYGLILCGFLEDMESGYRFGKLAIKVGEKFPKNEVNYIVLGLFNSFIKHWKNPVRQSIEGWQSDIITPLLEMGQIEHGCYNIQEYCKEIFLIGDNIEEVDQNQKKYIELLIKCKQELQIVMVKMWRQFTLNMLGQNQEKTCLIGNIFNEREALAGLVEQNNGWLLFNFWFIKLMLLYLCQEYPQAVAAAKFAEKYTQTGAGLMLVTQFNFYYSLALLADYRHVDFPVESDIEKTKQQYLTQVSLNQEKMKLWAYHAPSNCQHKYDLVEAEKARILGDNWLAMELYDRAISGAQNNEYLNEEALGNELAANFYLECHKEKIAKTYIIDAYYCYARWGANMKVNDLEERYRQLLMPVIKQEKVNILASHTLTESSRHTVTSSHSSISQILDFSSVMKACQVLSEQIVLEQLIAKLMQVTIENAGATKGILILLNNQTLLLAAKALSHEKEVIVSCTTPDDLSSEIPLTVINYIQHIRKPLVVNHPSLNNSWMTDVYIQENSPQCLLGLPLLHQNKLLGILYLENQLTADIFTLERLEVLNILTTQAAISLENANLYQTLQGSNKALIESLQKLQDAQLQMIQSEKMSALGNLVAGVAHEINNPVGFIAGNLNEATTAVQDLIDCLQCYQEKFPNPGSEIEEKLEEVDLEYLIEDLPKMLSSMKVGCDRIRNISTSLRTFSRADTNHKVAADVHEGIDSTLMILQHRIKAKDDHPAIQIIKNYGKLPKINCFLGQLNQVFMNILANAIDIFVEGNKGRNYKEIEAHPNVITITTEVSEDNQNIIIKIRDNGSGMSESVQGRIFDHLFTTKPVGKGTGLGLSISRQIVEEVHGGSITCESILGEGTEFCITLPRHLTP
ncbi:MAG: hypothetical protein RLZZ338_704 [Cyanobacteriota bacterium]